VESRDILNAFLILGFLIITACTLYVSFYFVQALKSVTKLADDLLDLTQNIKDKVAMKALTAIPALLVALVGKVIQKRRG